MLTNSLSWVGVQNENLRDTPTQAIVGTDGSLAFVVTTQVWQLDGKSLGQRKRFVVFDRPAVQAAIDAASWWEPDLVVLHPEREGCFIPHEPAARDAKPEDLPAPLRDGRRIPSASAATTRRGTEHHMVNMELKGRTYPVACSVAFRRYRPPAAAAVVAVLFVPAVVTDVITFPIQFPLGVYLYGTYFDRPDAPKWVHAVFTPVW
jgi:hypothetical protein